MRRVVILAWALGALPVAAVASAAESESEKVPAAFAPFEHLTGGWKGTAIPAANRLKGWPERHSWAWTFAQGRPVAMTLKIEGGQILAQGTLTYDPAAKRYRLEGTDPQGRPVAFVGELGDQGKMLTLNRQGPTPAGPERLTVRVLPENKIRYVMWLDRKGPGQPLFARVLDIGLTKEGETFAAGAAASSVPKCIITGGAATLSVTYEGKTYPLCCTGCRDEFLADPVKYVQTAARRAAASGPDTAGAAPASRPRENDGAFSGLVEEDEPASRPASRPQVPTTEPRSPRPAPGSATEVEPAPAPSTGTAPATSPSPQPKSDPARAGTLLRLGQTLERSGHPAGALQYYQQIVKEYPNTPEAQAAAARIAALSR